MSNPLNDPLLGPLRAMGVMFADPPPNTQGLAGITFDGSGNPLKIQNPAGVLKDFPGEGASSIPIPANNDGVDVVIESAPGGSVQIRTVPDLDGIIGEITISPNPVSGGEVGAQVTIRGGDSEDGAPAGSAFLTGGNEATSGHIGAQVEVEGGADTGNGSSLYLRVGHHGSGPGALVLGARLGDLAVPADTSLVTVAALGPAAGDLAISKWIPVTLDGVDGFLPFFTVVP